MWLSSNFELELKLKSITSRYVAPCYNEVADEKWEVLRIPRIDGDGHDIYHAFRWRHMRCMWISNATVSMDCRRKHLRQSLKVRLDCKMCLGRSGNVALCSHEQEVMKFIFHHPIGSIDVRREQQNPILDDEEGTFLQATKNRTNTPKWRLKIILPS